MFRKCIFPNSVSTAIQFKYDLKLLSVSQYLDVSNNSSYETDKTTPLVGFLSYIKNNNRKENDVPKGKENLALPRNWNLKKKELSLREKTLCTVAQVTLLKA